MSSKIVKKIIKNYNLTLRTLLCSLVFMQKKYLDFNTNILHVVGKLFVNENNSHGKT